jgi:hypothetical protein
MKDIEFNFTEQIVSMVTKFWDNLAFEDVRCEAASMRPSGRRFTDFSGHDRGTFAIGVRSASHGAVGWYWMPSISREKRRCRPQPIASGPEQSDSEQEIDGDQPLNVERGVRGNGTSNIKERVRGEY